VDDGPTGKTVAMLLTSDPIVVWPDTLVSEMAAMLDGSGVAAMPVVDWSGYLVGVVSRLDIIRVRASDNLSADWSRLCARHVMTTSVHTVTVDTPLQQAVRLVESLRIHRVVVVDDDGESPIGVLSATDLARAVSDPGDAQSIAAQGLRTSRRD
jgi:CBS domain-containing protein